VPNYHRVDADLFRSAHPSPRTLARAHADGVRAVLSLRGDADIAANIVERAACARLGLDLHSLAMSALNLPSPEMLLALVEMLRDVPKPVLVHCKSGADRTGLAVTLHLHVMRGVPIGEARRALALRYGHWHLGRAGIVHRLLDAYARDAADGGMGFETWARNRYDPAALA
jgi:protein tyrosine/serine phosphatase